MTLTTLVCPCRVLRLLPFGAIYAVYGATSLRLPVFMSGMFVGSLKPYLLDSCEFPLFVIRLSCISLLLVEPVPQRPITKIYGRVIDIFCDRVLIRILLMFFCISLTQSGVATTVRSRVRQTQRSAYVRRTKRRNKVVLFCAFLALLNSRRRTCTLTFNAETIPLIMVVTLYQTWVFSANPWLTARQEAVAIWR